MPPRLRQVVLVISLLYGCWLGMQAVHELGHVLGAWLTGGQVSQVVLHPLTISHTDLAHNPHPLPVVWGGPLVGVLLPLVGWAAACLARLPEQHLLRFFAGFCLLANGANIAGGASAGIGDCGEMLRHGTPIWLLWAFGLLTAPAGLRLWHGQGRQLGLSVDPSQVTLRAVAVSLTALAALVILGLIVGGE